jgi:hypothetical protein
MNKSRSITDLHVARYEYDSGWVVAADLLELAVDTENVTVDYLEDEAVIGIDTPTLNTEIDLMLPEQEAEHRFNNGVLVIENAP